MSEARASLRWLDDLTASDSGLVGGKVAHLAGLRAAGFAIPDGFAITAHAYRETVRASDAGRDLRRLMQLATERPDQAPAAARECADIVRNCAMPAHVQELIHDAYSQLSLRRRDPLPLVAVRSSALREDASDASSAGQYDSFLGISGGPAVVEAVQRCWASLFTERAVVYRAAHGIDIEASPMAVAVIELVDARASGVAFSVHPVTGDSERLVVESTFGWGEALVQGRVNPDHFELNRDDLRVLQRKVGTKQWVSTWSATRGEITEIPMPVVLISEPSLDDVELQSICRVLLQVEELLGHHIDLEWVWPRSGVGPVVVQARAETVHSNFSPREAEQFDPMTNALRHAFDRGGA